MSACWKEAESYGTLTHGPTLDPLTMFEDVFKEMPQNLVLQREQLQALRSAEPDLARPAPPVAQEG